MVRPGWRSGLRMLIAGALPILVVTVGFVVPAGADPVSDASAAFRSGKQLYVAPDAQFTSTQLMTFSSVLRPGDKIDIAAYSTTTLGSKTQGGALLQGLEAAVPNAIVVVASTAGFSVYGSPNILPGYTIGGLSNVAIASSRDVSTQLANFINGVHNAQAHPGRPIVPLPPPAPVPVHHSSGVAIFAGILGFLGLVALVVALLVWTKRKRAVQQHVSEQHADIEEYRHLVQANLLEAQQQVYTKLTEGSPEGVKANNLLNTAAQLIKEATTRGNLNVAQAKIDEANAIMDGRAYTAPVAPVHTDPTPAPSHLAQAATAARTAMANRGNVTPTMMQQRVAPPSRPTVIYVNNRTMDWTPFPRPGYRFFPGGWYDDDYIYPGYIPNDPWTQFLYTEAILDEYEEDHYRSEFWGDRDDFYDHRGFDDDSERDDDDGRADVGTSFTDPDQRDEGSSFTDPQDEGTSFPDPIQRDEGSSFTDPQDEGTSFPDPIQRDEGTRFPDPTPDPEPQTDYGNTFDPSPDMGSSFDS